MMIASIHQPEHLPWPHFIEKIVLSDIFVILDDVQFKKNNFQNRNKLILRNGEIFWATVPVEKGKLTDLIIEKKIVGVSWKKKYLSKIIQNYLQQDFFSEIYEPLENLIENSDDSLCNLNISIINYLLYEMKIKTQIVRSSELKVKGKKNELLINILNELSAKEYLAGLGSKSYLDLKLFDKNNIKVNFFNPIPWKYPILHSTQGLSIFDYMFRNGILKTRKKIDES
jgi:hypothetical protein